MCSEYFKARSLCYTSPPPPFSLLLLLLFLFPLLVVFALARRLSIVIFRDAENGFVDCNFLR